jgi:broad specificity phosphatase PhoE
VTTAAAGAATHQVWLVRHGTTEWSTAGRHTGRTDIPLTTGGEQAARALKAGLAAHQFALQLSSPLIRAVHTAELAGCSPELDPDLMEWDYGSYEGRTTAAIREGRPGWNIWANGVPGGESAEEVAARADRVIARARAADGDTLLFAHGHLLRILGARWIGAPPAAGQHLLLSTAAFCVLGWERETPALARWNDASHLDGQRQPLLSQAKRPE